MKPALFSSGLYCLSKSHRWIEVKRGWQHSSIKLCLNHFGFTVLKGWRFLPPAASFMSLISSPGKALVCNAIDKWLKISVSKCKAELAAAHHTLVLCSDPVTLNPAFALGAVPWTAPSLTLRSSARLSISGYNALVHFLSFNSTLNASPSDCTFMWN